MVEEEHPIHHSGLEKMNPLEGEVVDTSNPFEQDLNDHNLYINSPVPRIKFLMCGCRFG